ncbi:MAG: M20/M25/M40 family metallo-hydrolase [Lachnospiraceae bacterium]|nr:M20/M25/M40 family metallo-hydrolase [Lachnospiraceae bacterium]
MDERTMRYAGELSRMIRCETISVKGQNDYEKFYRFQELLRELFPALFAACTEEVFHGSLLLHWPGEHPEKAPVLFMNHQDVVPVSGEWEHEPFSGDIADGKIWGRGTLDDKGGLWAMLRAADELAAEGFVPDCDIWFESADAEEINGNNGEGADEISQILQERGIRFAFVLDEGGMIVKEPMLGAKGSYAMIGCGEKGTADLKIIARSRGGHASTPPKDTPLVRLGKFMAECDENRMFTVEMNPTVQEMFRRVSVGVDGLLKNVLSKPDVYKLPLEGIMNRTSPEGAAMLRTTLAFTMAQGSDGHNVLPQEAWVLGNMRTSHHQGFDDSLAAVKKVAGKYDLEVEVQLRGFTSPVTSFKCLGFRMLEQAVKELFPGVVPVPYIMNGASDARFMSRVSDNCLRFAPFSISREQMQSVHGPNENLDLAALAPAVDFYRWMMTHVG